MSPKVKTKEDCDEEVVEKVVEAVEEKKPRPKKKNFLKEEISDLPGVGKVTADALKAHGYLDFASIGVSTAKEIAEKCEIGEKTAQSIITAALEEVDLGEFITANELKEQRKNLRRLTTCSTALDNLFKNPKEGGTGGLESQSICEFFGEFGSGKTQICFQLCVNATMPIERGGLDSHVIVIDTENTFRPSRIEQISEALNLDVDKTLDKIHITRAFNSAHQMLLLEDKAYKLAQEVPIGLLVIDSLTAHFRSEYMGRGTLQDRQSQLSKHMRELLKFAYLNNCVVAVTNQVLTNPAQMFGDPIKPVGGNIVGHAATYRMYLRKAGKGGKRVARMIDAPEIKEDEVIINVSEAGIRDNE